MRCYCSIFSLTVCLVALFWSTGTAAPLQVEFPMQDVELTDAAIAPDGSVGVLYSRWQDRLLRLYSLSPWGSVVGDEQLSVEGKLYYSSNPSFLRYDDAGKPHVFLFSYPDLLHLTRSGATWTSEVVFSTSDYNEWQVRHRDDVFHVIAFPRPAMTLNCATPSNALLYINNLSGSWQSQELVSQQSDIRCLMDIDLAVGPQGIAHLVYSLQLRRSMQEVWPAELYYQTNHSGAFEEEIVDTDAPPNLDSAYRDLAIRMLKGQEPVISFQLHRNVITGSSASHSVRSAKRNSSATWSLTTVASNSDGYNGTDGTNFTGIQPDMAIDQTGTIRIIFSDLASSHVDGYQQATVGQIRMATDTGSGYTLETLFRQSAAAEEQVKSLRLLVPPDGSGFDIFGVTYSGTSYPPPDPQMVHVFTPKSITIPDPPILGPILLLLLPDS